ncbi:hypothetical protein V6N13_092346 [Hibiscus sabdariffa]|uniref:Uncharacterized protein n=1 Tax=Hibiscus sabdariffa TaxID=183260 RepID=A0ABR2CC50_9ROSI
MDIICFAYVFLQDREEAKTAYIAETNNVGTHDSTSRPLLVTLMPELCHRADHLLFIEQLMRLLRRDLSSRKGDKWQPPRALHVKCNIDASSFAEEQVEGFAGTVRDARPRSDSQMFSTGFGSANSDPKVIEAYATREALPRHKGL